MTPAQVLDYSTARLERLHCPTGYSDYKSFKPWLRDEFQFQCAYCLWREAWCADGDGSFSVDHLRPQELRPDLSCEYNNLIYACCRCNSAKRNRSMPVDPCADGWGNHLRSNSDGTVHALTPAGLEIIEVCRLNRAELVRARRVLRQLLDFLAADGTHQSRSLLDEYLSFPIDLPILADLSPPNGNTHPEGIAASHYERKKRGELPETY